VPENESSDLIQQRKKKLQAIVDLGYEAYPRKFDVTHTIPQIVAEYAARSAEELAARKIPVRVAGRVMTIRPHGKAGFAHLAGGGSACKSTFGWTPSGSAISSFTSSSISGT
jgi:lysyl-tRNA synthetase class II